MNFEFWICEFDLVVEWKGFFDGIEYLYEVVVCVCIGNLFDLGSNFV